MDQKNMVALIITYSADVCKCESRAYKVKDSNEENGDRGYTNHFTGDGSSAGGFYGSGFHFPDFFNDGNKDADGGNNFGLGTSFASPFPSFSESRSSDSTYIVPANTYRTGSNYDRSHQTVPVSKSAPVRDAEYRSSKKPISSLYDDWKPGDEQPRGAKWSQEHVDDDSAEQPATRSNSNFALSGPYRGQNNYGRPYSETSLRQHYKPLRPVGNTNLPGHGEEVRVHTHKYGVNHVYDPKKKPDEPYYVKNNEDRLRDTKPQQFDTKPNHYRNDRPPSRSSYSDSPPRSYSDSPPRSYGDSPPRSYSDSPPRSYYTDSPHSYSDSPRSKDSFKPSPPDYFKNSRTDRNFDFFSDSSKLAPTKVKADKNHEQLDKSCIKNNKTTTINLSDGQISLSCYECYDKKHSRPYEQCTEVPQNTGKAHKRHKRDVNGSSIAQPPPTGREKRQQDDYYDVGDGSYGPDSSDYRFGPEHFTDDYPSSYEEGGGLGGGEEHDNADYDSEKCFKAKKGDMLCITCENRVTGGTYQQCSYASDPKKNSYERSISKVYGSPRLPEENRRKQVDTGPPKRPVYSKKKLYSGPSGIRSNGPAYRNLAKGKRSGQRSAPLTRDYSDGTELKYRGSPGRSPLPNKVLSRERSVNRTPASTKLRGPPRSGRPRSSGSATLDPYGYPPSGRSPPPSSRAYSTPSSLVSDPYSYDIPDPYSPDPVSLIDDTGINVRSHGARNRKNIDSSYDPGYDETFAGLFPELVDADPSSAVALAPPTYDEYPDGDYDEGPERRTDKHDQYLSRNSSRLSPLQDGSAPVERSSTPDGFSHRKGACKKVRKNKMTCYQCVDDTGTKHEECTYVNGSEPKSKQLTYREVKELTYDPAGGTNGSQQRTPTSSYLTNTKSSDENRRGKRKFKKYNPEEHNSEGKDGNGNQWHTKIGRDHNRRNSDASSDRYNVTVDHNGRSSHSNGYPTRGDIREKREDDPEEKTNSEIERATRRNYDPIPTDPPQLANIGENPSEEGEFSADTELKFDPVLGLSLPKYMLEKSEHEAIFDEVLASGKK